MTCKDCKHKNRCMERSRNIPCRDFKKRGGDVDNKRNSQKLPNAET